MRLWTRFKDWVCRRREQSTATVQAQEAVNVAKEEGHQNQQFHETLNRAAERREEEILREFDRRLEILLGHPHDNTRRTSH